MDFSYIFRIDSPEKGAFALAKSRVEGKKRTEGASREDVSATREDLAPSLHCSHPSPNLVKHTSEIKRPCADIVYDLGAI